MAWEVSTKVLGIPAERIWVSVFETDDDAYNLWLEKVILHDFVHPLFPLVLK